MQREPRKPRAPIVTGGAWDVPPDWLGATCVVTGMAAMALGLLPGEQARSAEGMLARFLFVTSGLFTLGLGAWMGWLRREMLAAVRLDELAGAHGVSVADLERALQDRGIAPRFISNGRPYYDPADIGDGALLVRPAELPDAAVLVRPAPAETLLAHVAVPPEAGSDREPGDDPRPERERADAVQL